jgi:hypothetical protein
MEKSFDFSIGGVSYPSVWLLEMLVNLDDERGLNHFGLICLRGLNLRGLALPDPHMG